jgi:hypothetical protein
LILPGNAMSQLKDIDLFGLVGVDEIATIFTVVFVALIIVVAR